MFFALKKMNFINNSDMSELIHEKIDNQKFSEDNLASNSKK